MCTLIDPCSYIEIRLLTIISFVYASKMYFMFVELIDEPSESDDGLCSSLNRGTALGTDCTECFVFEESVVAMVASFP